MSIAVELADLEATLAKYPFVYLLTVGDQPRPHILALPVRMQDGLVVVPAQGRGSRSRIETNALVTLLAPPHEPGGYSLIVDGTATLADDAVLVTPTWAVLHRPAPTAH
ncbi:MAG: pyridoxamine 5'-phosphate oxidase family protein [Sporichthyaceae bacterium]